MYKTLHLSFAVLIGLLNLTINAHAEQLPQWEAGVGASVIRFNDYRGSDESKFFLFPLPYFVYRGERIVVERERVRGLFFKNDVMELDGSINGTVPLKSKDNVARTGMPDLDATLEIGPSINTTLWRSENRQSKLVYKIPARAVISTNKFRQFDGRGWVSNPQLAGDIKDFLGSGWHVGIIGGPVFQSKKYNQFLYGVDPQYATSTRAAYAAKGGYAGLSFILGASKRMDPYWLSGFMKIDSLHRAKFADSPLVKQKLVFTVGVAATWQFAKSDKLVEADD